MSLVEAMTAGTNILVSDLGGMREMVETSRVGFRFTPGDGQSLESALRTIRANFDSGTLNDFDASLFLKQRTCDSYMNGLLEIYGLPSDHPARSHSDAEVAS